MPIPTQHFEPSEFPGFTAAQIQAGLTVPACTAVVPLLTMLPSGH
jgi:hypothetical protein